MVADVQLRTFHPPIRTGPGVSPLAGPVADLVASGLRRLGEEWGAEVTAGPVRLQHRARAVFDVVTPDGQPAVVKVSADPYQAERERLALYAARSGGVPVPPVLGFIPGRPAVMVLGFVTGTALGAEDSGPAWASAGEAVARLHTVVPRAGLHTFGRAATPWMTWLRRWLDVERARSDHLRRELGDVLVDSALDRVEAGLARAEPVTTRAVVHGDCQPAHILLDGDRHTVSGLIDFGDAGCGDPAWDLAILTAHQPAQLDDVVAGYQPDGAFHSHLAQVVEAYQLLRLVGEVPWLVEHGFDPRTPLDALRQRITG